MSTMGRVNCFIFSDASNNALGAVGSNNQIMCHKNFSLFEKIKSSTWRELEGIRFSLISYGTDIYEITRFNIELRAMDFS